MKSHDIIEVISTVNSWEAVSEWEALEGITTWDQETDPIFFNTKALTGGKEQEARNNFVPRPSSLV